MLEDRIVVLNEFNRLINSTENVYLDILNEALPFIASNFPGGEIALKVCKSLSKLQNSSIKAFLLETGNQDIRTAIKIITNDLDGKNFDYELVQALTLLKRGRDTFLNLIDKEYRTWDWFRRIDQIRNNYAKAFIASSFIAFCYKLLNDNTKADKVFDECKLYFYYHLYHYSGKAREKMEGYTIKSVLFVIEGQWSMHSRINSSKEIKEQDEKAKKVVISLYELLQAEEENFIKMSKSVFGKSLTKELGKNSFRTEQKRLGVSKSFIKVFAEIYTRWEPPVTHW
jgi:hypothetical protein